MKSYFSPDSYSQKTLFSILIGAIFLVVVGYGGYRLFSEKTALEKTVLSLQASLKTQGDSLAEITSERDALKEEKSALSDELSQSEQKAASSESQVKKISKTVTNLKKLAETDPELLKKYSKIYFLNENYVPSRLTDISDKYLLTKDKPLQIHADVYPHLKELLEDALDDDVTLKIVSAYRSFGIQAALKSSYTVIYGAGTANQFSAEQGYSEHQLGTAVDFSGDNLAGALTISFDASPEYKWLSENAYRYGFILSYPKGNAYYQYEPWHWRFVGEELSRELHREKKNFYDLDQREIDTYLLGIFD